MLLAEGFLPGSKELIPIVMNDCVAPDGNYSSSFAFYGQEAGSEQCDPSVTVDTDAVDLSVLGDLGDLVPTVGAQSKDETADEDAAAEAELPRAQTEAEAGSGRSMDQALTVFSVITAEDCGANLLKGKSDLIGALTPCIVAEAPTRVCCSAVEDVFRPDNEDFGGCLCHKEVMDGIFAEAEGFLPGSTTLIKKAFDVCTNDFGSHFSFHGQEIGHVACSGESELKKPSMAQAAKGGSEEGEEEHPLEGLREIFGDPQNSAAPGQGPVLVSAFALAASVVAAVLF